MIVIINAHSYLIDAPPMFPKFGSSLPISIYGCDDELDAAALPLPLPLPLPPPRYGRIPLSLADHASFVSERVAVVAALFLLWSYVSHKVCVGDFCCWWYLGALYKHYSIRPFDLLCKRALLPYSLG